MNVVRVPLVLLTLIATPALALEINEKVEVGATPEQTWAAIKDFCSIQTWHPVIAACSSAKEGGVTMRTLTTGDGGVLLEKRVMYSDEAMSYSYELIESPLPIRGYESTLAVSDAGDGAVIEWNGAFEADGVADEEAVELMTGIYRAGLDALKGQLAP